MRIEKTRKFAVTAVEDVCETAPVPVCWEKTVLLDDGTKRYVWLLNAGEEHTVNVTETSCIAECRELDKSFGDGLVSPDGIPCVEDSLPYGKPSLAAFAAAFPDFVSVLLNLLADAGDGRFIGGFVSGMDDDDWDEGEEEYEEEEDENEEEGEDGDNDETGDEAAPAETPPEADGPAEIVRDGVAWSRGPNGKWSGPAADVLADLLDDAAECVGE